MEKFQSLHSAPHSHVPLALDPRQMSAIQTLDFHLVLLNVRVRLFLITQSDLFYFISLHPFAVHDGFFP